MTYILVRLKSRESESPNLPAKDDAIVTGKQTFYNGRNGLNCVFVYFQTSGVARFVSHSPLHAEDGNQTEQPHCGGETVGNDEVSVWEREKG